MIDEIPDGAGGPGKLRVFLHLAGFLALLIVLGTILSAFHDIHWLENLVLYLLKRPDMLLGIAGVISISLLLVKNWSFLQGGRSGPW